MPISSLALGLICILTLFDDSYWDTDTVVGFGLFAFSGFIFGVISLNRQSDGEAMAIAGVVLTVIASLALVGVLVE